MKAKIMDERVWSLMTSVPLRYNPHSPNGIVPDDLLPYMGGRHFLSTKQVPSALILSRAGSQSVSRCQTDLLNHGFAIEQITWGEDGTPTISPVLATRGPLPSYSESLGSLLREAQGEMEHASTEASDIADGQDHSGSETSEAEELLEPAGPGQIRRRKDPTKRIKYEDPWKLHAASALASLQGKPGPEIVVWSGDGIRLQDPLPSRLLGPDWEGSVRNKIRFHRIAADSVKRHVIYGHTHWGQRLRRECSDPDSKIGYWARTLRHRINRFLAGGPDPLWTTEERMVISGTEWKTRDRGGRALRLIELLKTVDGVFTQRYLANPAEAWTWERFDMFTLGNISLLLGDEFLDGEIPKDFLTVRTSYSTLKWTRKWFKMVAHRGTFEQETQCPSEGKEWARLHWRSWQNLKGAERYDRLLIIGVLSQTRGCGTPPPLVVLQAKHKFLETVASRPAQESPTMRALRRTAIEEILNELPVAAVTGLGTKSRVTVTSAASWEKTRRQGGTIEAVKEMLNSIDPMSMVPKRNLDTGGVEETLFPEEFDSVGELIFWVCLDLVLRTPPEELRMAFLTVVKEPGKARSVTKARACLKIVLDLVSKICSEPLAKGIRSSHSGMTASNHGWNFFNSLSGELEREETFRVLHREESLFEGYVERTDTFEDLFVSSTDYSEATDSMRHDVALDLGAAWMIKCGIPAVLRGIVIETCYKPRTIFFKATGLLEDVGDPYPEFGEDIRKITLRQGVLMGDPLTKPVLHLLNVSVRHLSKRIIDPDFYSRFQNRNAIMEAINGVGR